MVVSGMQTKGTISFFLFIFDPHFQRKPTTVFSIILGLINGDGREHINGYYILLVLFVHRTKLNRWICQFFRVA